MVAKVANLKSLRFDDPYLADVADQAAEQVGISPDLLNAVRMAGQSKNSYVRSPRGGVGIYQFSPSAMKDYDLADATDPVASTFAAARMLKAQIQRFGTPLAAAAFYRGNETQAKLVAGGKEPSDKDTQRFLDNVKSYMSAKAPKADPLQAPAPTQAPAQPQPSPGPQAPANPKASSLYGIDPAPPIQGVGAVFDGQNFADPGVGNFDMNFNKGIGGSEAMTYVTQPDYGVPSNPIQNIDPGVALTAELRKIVDQVTG